MRLWALEMIKAFVYYFYINAEFLTHSFKYTVNATAHTKAILHTSCDNLNNSLRIDFLKC